MISPTPCHHASGALVGLSHRQTNTHTHTHTHTHTNTRLPMDSLTMVCIETESSLRVADASMTWVWKASEIHTRTYRITRCGGAGMEKRDKYTMGLSCLSLCNSNTVERKEVTGDWNITQRDMIGRGQPRTLNGPATS